MFVLLVMAAVQANQPSAIVVGGWDARPTLTVAEGNGKDLAPLKAVARGCGFSRTWLWDDDSDKAQLWVVASEASREKKDCLNHWRSHYRSARLNWMLRPQH